MKSYNVLKKEIRRITKDVVNTTKSKFSKEIKLLEKQESVLFKFLFNFNLWEIGLKDNNLLYITINLFSDSIQNARIIRRLVIEGQYNAAGALLRNIFETMLLMEYLRKYPSNWKEWWEYQSLEETEREKPFNKKSRRLRQLRNKFTISKLIRNRTNQMEIENYKWTYSYLCSISHLSIERLRRISKGVKGTGFIIKYSPEFNEKVANYNFNSLFTLINNILLEFLLIIKLEDEPDIIKKYRKIGEIKNEDRNE